MPSIKPKKHVIKCGLIKATVQMRFTKGQIRFSLSLVRLYLDGDCWKESKRFGPDDIPVMRLVLDKAYAWIWICLLYTSPSPRDRTRSRMPSSA